MGTAESLGERVPPGGSDGGDHHVTSAEIIWMLGGLKQLDVGKTMESNRTWGLTYKPGWESWLSCRKSQSLILCFGTLKMLRHFVELDGELRLSGLLSK